MVLHKKQIVRRQKQADPVANRDVISYTKIDYMSCEYVLGDDNDEIGVEYGNSLNFAANEKWEESDKKHREKDDKHDENCYYEGVNDPQYVLFLTKAKKHGKGFIVEGKGKEIGSTVTLPYEEDSSLNNECDLEPRRKLRSSMKQKRGPPNQIPGVENQRSLSKRQSRNKHGNERKVKLSTYKSRQGNPDQDYSFLRRHSKILHGYYVYNYGGNRVVFEQSKNVENNHEKEECSDASSSDIQEIDRATFLKDVDCVVELSDEENNHENEEYNDVKNLHLSTRNAGSFFESKDVTKFRNEVIAVLRKPYDQREYDRLCQDINLRRPGERHLELRHGRERSCLIKKDGKSLLDHYPELERKLLLLSDDKPRCLNLLRGFFFWLEKLGPLHPWEDAECLAMSPELR